MASREIAHAQETINQATVSGRVLDSQGAAVPGAMVSVRQTDTNVTVSATTETDGRFRFPYLKIGPYELRAKLQGFKENARTLALSAGSAFDISITLEVAGIDTAVTVVADSQVLETARSQIAGTVPQAEVQNLPMNGRNFLDLALLVPGVSPTNTNSTQLFAETSAVPGQGLSIASQRNLSNSFIVDGVSANDDAAGLSGITFGVDAIEQFQVVTGGGQAELGRALGGYVNVVTKSGTNALHGTLYGFFRDDAFNGKNALTGTTLPMDQQQFGDEPRRTSRAEPHVLFHEHRAQAARSDRRRQHHCPRTSRRSTRGWRRSATRGCRSTTGIYPNPVHSSNVLGKIDHQFSGADQLSVRYALYDVISENARGVGNLNAPSGSTGLDNLDQSIAIGNVWTIVIEHGQRNACADRPRRPEGAFDRSDRTAGHHFRRGDVRHVFEQPDAAREHAVPGRQQPVAPSRRACAARWRRLSLQRRHHHLPAHVPRQLHVLVAGQLPDRQLQRIRADVRRSRGRTRRTRISASTPRTSGAPARG